MGILDYLALAAVFIGLLSIGRWSSKKTRRADDFLLAGRSLNKLQAGFSLAASDLGGSGLLGTCSRLSGHVHPRQSGRPAGGLQLLLLQGLRHLRQRLPLRGHHHGKGGEVT